jgi:predicted O-methyltransferase YrrM
MTWCSAGAAQLAPGASISPLRPAGADSMAKVPLPHRLRNALRALRGQEDAAPAAPAPVAADPAPEEIDEIGRAIEVLAAASIETVQERGFHFQRRDYYSALNDLPFLRENPDLWHDRPPPPAIPWDLDDQISRVRGFSAYLGELAEVPFEAPEGEPGYHWDNNFWRGADALMHYGLLRQVKPRRVVEVGCGWSSLLMAQALARNEEEGAPAAAVDQIEPYPRKQLLSALPAEWRLHETILQRADLSLFESLGRGDVCFFDGSHVARAGSDVVWFFFEVLPRLAPGVLVHVHDIFWPADYPDEWIFERGQTWNEQYVLQAFLMYNQAFRPLVCNSMLFQHRRADLDELFAPAPETQHSGVSVWLEALGG